MLKAEVTEAFRQGQQDKMSVKDHFVCRVNMEREADRM